MKIFNSRTVLLTTAFLIVILFSKCASKISAQKCCEGYTGQISNPLAAQLVKTCHFIEQDSIVAWTRRYQEFKKSRGTGSEPDKQALPGVGDLLGDSASFNSCIIKKIICNEKSIGLRVVYGMSDNKKIHVIFVGVSPDYSTLYIMEPEECCTPAALKLKSAGGGGSTGKLGGAEYGQLP